MAYGHPDFGLSLSYQDFKNEYLGKNTSLYGHYSFYFLKRNFFFRIGQGIAYASNPYDSEKNFKNHAFGSKFMASVLIMINYKKERLLGDLGFQVRFNTIHYSNGNTKAPNSSINVFSLNAGLNYSIGSENHQKQIKQVYPRFKEPLRYTIVFRGGLNQSDVIRSRQYPFYVFSAYIDKRLGYKSAIQFGTEAFLTLYLKEHIRFSGIAYPGET